MSSMSILDSMKNRFSEMSPLTFISSRPNADFVPGVGREAGGHRAPPVLLELKCTNF